MSITKVKIVPFESKYASAFKAINQAWIEEYFKMEASDFKALDHPKENIIAKGGYIAIALLDDEVVGVCGLIKMNDTEFDYELAKMGVTPKAQGKKVGIQLGQHILNVAKERGAKKIYIESNTILKPAIQLYRKMGFVEINGIKSPYERCNIQLVLEL
ncbi:hypothetical protein GCM10011414_17280 [Croceivirga lutea]|uniref:GNAT family N-acetyltransferase n=1 Tax=Croceivirga lutea TaxID=1775167 RepID=UPI00163999E8|nr:GNAT family N-acetyltransferase [Croceivirga lutea]GGG48076.1 hypothetical protein GCM10011414_17280 [Croceivirga lutea]